MRHEWHQALLAHQGGWDEILLVIGPMAVIVALLAVARRRVSRSSARTTETDETVSPRG
jgi:hypothetical protein